MYENIRPKKFVKSLSKEQKTFLKIARSLVIFQNISEEKLLKIVKSIRLVSYSDGEVIYKHMESVRSIDYTLKGAVDIYTPDNKFVGTIPKKSIFGEQLFNQNHLFRSINIIAKGDVVLVCISIDFHQKTKYPEVFIKLYENVFKIVFTKLFTLINSHSNNINNK